MVNVSYLSAALVLVAERNNNNFFKRPLKLEKIPSLVFMLSMFTYIYTHRKELTL